MTYLLDNTQKIEILKSNNIPFGTTKNTVYVNGLDITNTSDENFETLVIECSLNIDNIVSVSTSKLLVDEVKVTPSIKNSFRSRFKNLEEVKDYCRSLTYSYMFLYSREAGFVTINLNNN